MLRLPPQPLALPLSPLLVVPRLEPGLEDLKWVLLDLNQLDQWILALASELLLKLLQLKRTLEPKRLAIELAIERTQMLGPTTGAIYRTLIDQPVTPPAVDPFDRAPVAECLGADSTAGE